MSAPTVIPRAPLALGLSGLIPFWGLALAIGLQPATLPAADRLAFALACYGAVIVSFLGGIRWGLATVRPDQPRVALHYATAVLPSLLAWAAFALPPGGQLAALGVVALGLGFLDLHLVSEGLAPPWFGRLRVILSSGAGAALLLAAVFVLERA